MISSGGAPRRSRARRAAILAGAMGVLVAVLAATATARPANEDFRISRSGGIGPGTNGEATEPAVAYNPSADEYLVAWEADDSELGVNNNELEIAARVLDGNGDPLGPAFLVSDAGGVGASVNVDAASPAVAYNPVADEYLVAWESDDPDAGLSTSVGFNEFEIFAQRLDSDGTELGPNDFLVSDAGGINEDLADAEQASVAYNAADNEYLVTWRADDTDTAGIVDDEDEIFGQRLNAAGGEIGSNDFRVSDVGGDGVAAPGATVPAATHNPTANEYLVVWRADDTDEAGIVDNEFEIYGQRLDATGGETGTNDFRISDVGGTGDNDPSASSPAVAHNPTADEYMVAWQADDTDAGLADDENEIFAQRLDGAGAETGANDFRVSDAAGTGDADFDAQEPAIAANPDEDEYLVAWEADDADAAGIVEGEFEIFAQRLDASGAEVGANDARISETSPSGDAARDAETPAAAYRSDGGEYLVAWEADNADTGLQDNDDEIHALRFVRPLNVSAPEISGTALVGGTLSCSDGSWIFGPDDFAYQWRRAGADIPGATNADYTVTENDIGETVSCRVTATNSAGSRSAASPPVVPPQNPPGLVVLITSSGKLTAERGNQVKLRYVSTRDGAATLDVVRKQNKKTVASVNDVAAEGRNKITWDGKRGNGKAAKPGPYKLKVTVETPGGQEQTDSAKLKVRKG